MVVQLNREIDPNYIARSVIHDATDPAQANDPEALRKAKDARAAVYYAGEYAKGNFDILSIRFRVKDEGDTENPFDVDTVAADPLKDERVVVLGSDEAKLAKVREALQILQGEAVA